MLITYTSLRKTITALTWLCLSGLFFAGCANYKLNYTREGASWPNAPYPADVQPAYSIYLIGDGGNDPREDPSPAVTLLKQELEHAPEKSAVIFLGDNIYPDGFASKNETQLRSSDESKLEAQLDAVKDYPGKVFFIPGNHDWYTYGIEGLKRERKFIEKYLGDRKVWFPYPGCGDPEEIDLDDNLVLVLLDSQWYLTDWEGETEINADCSVKDRVAFRNDFDQILKSNRNKNVVIAMHHPMYSNGPHGGQFTVKDHFFPLTAANPKLYIPLPVIGTLGAFLRANVGSRQDLAHPRYKNLRDGLLGAARKYGSFIFVAGHEHTLQYIERDSQVFIISGAGSKQSAARAAGPVEFAYGHQGFSRLDFYPDGSGWATFLVPENGKGRVVFRKQIKQPLPHADVPPPSSFKPIPPDATETKEITDRLNFRKNAFGRFIWGDHYRDAYHTPIEVPVLDLARFKGGVTAFKQGGGFQTNSLRLVNEKTGRQYALRSMDKDATRTVPYPFKSSLTLDIVEDNFSASYPLSALIVPPLADAAKVFHTNPLIAYVPKQPGLGVFNDQFGNALYLVEERPDDDLWMEDPDFGNPDKVVSTPDVLEAIQGDQDDRIDQIWTVRTRLFDMVIGDWDRHDDQWRWSRIEKDGLKLYRPIPRDRDQAFSNYDGLMLGLARQTFPFAKQLRPFRKGPGKVKWSNFNGRQFDQTFLTGLELDHWEREARFLQEQITDELIDSTLVSTLPPQLYAIDGKNLAAGIRLRRDHLLDYAREHYRHLARKVDILGTEKRELFSVERLPDGQTLVNIFDITKSDKRKDILYQRHFKPGETKEIRLYGLDGDDLFEFKGDAPKGVLVRAIGGLGQDEFIDESHVGGGKRTIIYDAREEKNKIKPGSEARLRITGHPDLNTYDRRSNDNDYNYSIILPAISGNPDDGLELAGIGQFVTYGFKKNPYASSHQLKAQLALETGGGRIEYKGEFIDLFGTWELFLGAELQTALYASNFYGIGNTTVNPEMELEDEYNRLKERVIRFYPAFMKKLPGQAFFTVGPTFESIRVERTEGRYIDQIGDSVDPEIFEGVEFGGAHLRFSFRNQDSPSFPTRGLAFQADGGWKRQFENADNQFAYLDAGLSFYQRLVPSGALVLASRVGFEHRFNDKFAFFQAATLGGTGINSNFRGLRRERYSGHTAFFQNIDLRWKILTSNNRALPFSLGIYGGFDHGRVWADVDEPDVWHTSYGGGLYASPFDVLTLQLGMFKSEENFWRFGFGSAFFF
ncbi:MAG: metallophosphoesterase [Lewinellaceae bacterium]|nr:metallophosphoesterase [Lewinella sp.]MCB9278727.1 metallophosphoesterase [Lewinellaceae bacterium]